MNKIGTHNSATGEKGSGLLSWLVTPFAKCQSKTIEEQYNAGSRVFDLRVKFIKNKGLKFAHGIWYSSVDIHNILTFLNDKKCYVLMTYEGSFGKNFTEKDYLHSIEDIKYRFKDIRWLDISVKRGYEGKWQTLVASNHNLPIKQGFVALDGSSWHTLIPIPWLWNKLYSVGKMSDNWHLLLDFL